MKIVWGGIAAATSVIWFIVCKAISRRNAKRMGLLLFLACPLAQASGELEQGPFVDSATATDPAPPRAFTFTDEGQEIGRLDWSTGQMKFTGDADSSARVFFESFTTLWDAYVLERTQECRGATP